MRITGEWSETKLKPLKRGNKDIKFRITAWKTRSHIGNILKIKSGVKHYVDCEMGNFHGTSTKYSIENSKLYEIHRHSTSSFL